METEKKHLTDRTQILKKLVILLYPWLDDIDQPERLDEQTNLLTDLGLDSVAILRFILDIEKEFNITIKDNELDSGVFSKMGNLIGIIDGKVNEID